MNPHHTVPSQRSAIHAHLAGGAPLTRLTALREYGCLHLGGRIFELRQDGIPVQDRWIILASGKRVKQYYLEPES